MKVGLRHLISTTLESPNPKKHENQNPKKHEDQNSKKHENQNPSQAYAHHR